MYGTLWYEYSVYDIYEKEAKCIIGYLSTRNIFISRVALYKLHMLYLRYFIRGKRNLCRMSKGTSLCTARSQGKKFYTRKEALILTKAIVQNDIFQ